MMTNSPALWESLRKQAPPGSVLMGGAIVDYIAGHEAKDYDFFHMYTPGQPHVPDNWVFNEQDYNDPDWVNQHNAEYLENADGSPSNIASVYDYTVQTINGPIAVQLIGLRNLPEPKAYFKQFDHSLTLGMWTKAGMFVHRKVFESLHNREITYLGEDNQFKKNRSFKRAMRKVFKYQQPNNLLWNFKGFD